MIDVDDRVRAELERLVPLDDAGADWESLVRRAGERRYGRPRRRRRAVALAVVAAAAGALAISPVGAAVGRGLDDFSAWLRGDPGEPASQVEQHEFEREARSWSGFPETPKLRRLLARELGGSRYELYGFRIGESLCLRLVARGSGDDPATSCAPLRDLRAAGAPALVLLADHPLGTRGVPASALPGEYAPVRASATFGVVADGVNQVELVGDGGPRDAIVAGNAFLHVTTDPPVGERVREAFARDATGARRRIPLASAPFGLTDVPAAQNADPGGPTRVERTVRGATIGWLERREPRGAPLREEAPELAAGLRGLTFGRVVRPDPSSFVRMFVALADMPLPPVAGGAGRSLCWGEVGARPTAFGCAPFAGFFDRGGVGPLLATLNERGGDQYAVVDGLASDVVARIELFLGTGERVAVPLRDNVFHAEIARTKLPVRVVGYDAQHGVVSTRVYGEAGGVRAPRAAGKERVVMTVRGRDATAVLRVAPSTDGGRCWRISYSSGAEGGGCPPKSYRGPVLDAALRSVGGDVFVEAEVASEVARVVIDGADRRPVTLRPVEGFVIHPLRTDATEVSVTVHAFAADGRELARRGVRIDR